MLKKLSSKSLSSGDKLAVFPKTAGFLRSIFSSIKEIINLPTKLENNDEIHINRKIGIAPDLHKNLKKEGRRTPIEQAIAGDHPLNILVAEDNLANQKVIELMLRKLGYLPTTTFVSNGDEALSAFDQKSFDVVFMDILMPVLNGYDATREIRKMFLKCTCPKIIALTASAFKSDRDKAEEAGMHDFITKPIRYIELKQVLLESEAIHSPPTA